MTQFDIVQKPKHYNVHPSGIECITITEQMRHTIGNAYKYVFRREHKDQTLQDLEKALFYVNREINRLKNPGQPRTVVGLTSVVTAYEPSPYDRILMCLAKADEDISSLDNLEKAVFYLTDVIQEMKNESKGS
jgi:hypothetical protein